MIDIQSRTSAKMARIEFLDTEHVPDLSKEDIEEAGAIEEAGSSEDFYVAYIQWLESSRFELVIRLLLTVGETTNGIREYAIKVHFAIENEQWGIIRSSTANRRPTTFNLSKLTCVTFHFQRYVRHEYLLNSNDRGTEW